MENIYKIIADEIKEVQDEIITEAVNHLITTQSSDIEDEGRYLIGNDELKAFLKKFKKVMVKKILNNEPHSRFVDLRIGKVEELSYADSPYFEVCRKKYYEKNPEFFFS